MLWDALMTQPHVMYHRNKYHMWFTRQSPARSDILYSTSDDGIVWKESSDPVRMKFLLSITSMDVYIITCVL